MCPGRAYDPPWAVFIVCVGTHLPMGLTVMLLHRRRLFFECVLAMFAVLTSLLYHSCDCLQMVVYLDAMQWHRLDNIGAISCIVVTCIHLSGIDNAMVEGYAKFAALALVIILQEGYPWNVLYTIVPVLTGVLIPLTCRFFAKRGLRGLIAKRAGIGLLFLLPAVLFFVLGLDDAHDPFRIFHGLFHCFIALSVNFLWLSIKVPIRKVRQEADASPTYVVISA